MNSIDDIVDNAHKKFGYEGVDKTRGSEFLSRYIAQNEDLGSNCTRNAYEKVIHAALHIYHVLMRDVTVNCSPYEGGVITLEKDHHLAVLAIPKSPSNGEMWDDPNLKNAYVSTSGRTGKSNIIHYKAMINEIGKDQDIVALWGREITYDDIQAAKKRGIKVGARGRLTNDSVGVRGGPTRGELVEGAFPPGRTHHSISDMPLLPGWASGPGLKNFY